ncbi:hypothetical protein GCK72_016649 [Caenorhabditis remanei]|uniref:Uncharacterized protein n=1 Tax=Caenorhabditis remanei TaxID=31234 RepID=A0A6A5G5L8_CAERE|nr:hypothetical protein GCK72_016649 [Caenorhabditis remanei]KAF1750103.1 hypothetical protein GCK72_016649 [Caenorhabditis remanei]
MAPSHTTVLASQASVGQFDSTRTQTKMFAGKSKKTVPITPTISEEDIFEQKCRKEFPEYVERKKDKNTWKQFYQKRMDKKQKKQEEKMKKLTSRIGKSTAIQQKSAPKTKLIDIVGFTSGKKFGQSSKLRPLPTSQMTSITISTPNVLVPVTKPRQVIAPLQGPTQVRRVPPAAVTRTFTQNGGSTKKTTPLMRKCLQMMKK